MISGFSISGMALQKPQYIERAVKAALFLKQHLYDSQSNVRIYSLSKNEMSKMDKSKMRCVFRQVFKMKLNYMTLKYVIV